MPLNNNIISTTEKNNILANFDLENDNNLFKKLKKKISDLGTNQSDKNPPIESNFTNQYNDNRFSRSRSRSFNRRLRNQGSGARRNSGHENNFNKLGKIL